MWMTVMIVGGLFVAMIAMLYLNVEDSERRRAEQGKPTTPAGPATPGHCMLCESPLPTRRSADEVVHDLEHRIDADLKDIDRAIHGGAPHVHRLYLA